MAKSVKVLFFTTIFILLVAFLYNFINPSKVELNTNLKLNPLFNENAVLQREKPIKIFGTAKPDSKIELSLANRKGSTKTNKNGDWLISLKPIKAGGPYKLKVKSGQTIVLIKHIYVGDVWLSAGQSNLVRFVDSVMNAEKNIAEANNYTNKIFILNLNTVNPSEKPITAFDSIHYKWATIDNQTVRESPAVPYAFARKLYHDQKIPIGIVQAATSNTLIQAHMSQESLVGYKDLEKIKAQALGEQAIWYRIAFAVKRLYPDIPYWTLCVGEPSHDQYLTVFTNGRKVINDYAYANCNYLDSKTLFLENKIEARIFPKKLKNISLDEIAKGLKKSKVKIDGAELLLDAWQVFPEISPNTPSSIFNSKIDLITRYPIKGIIWYQGESNINDYASYKQLFTALVKDWRKRWQEELPFITVQLHNFKTENPENLLKFREVQRELSTEINKVYMIDAFDLSDEDLDVHPKNKDEVGYRLALMAKNKVYSK